MKRNFILFALFFQITLFASGSDEKSSLSVLNVAGLKGPTSIGMLSIFNSPPILGNETQVEITAVDEPAIMTARVLSGEVDAAAVPINLAAILYNKGAEYKIAAITGSGNLFIVTSDPGIGSLNDLKDKKVHGIGKGSTPEYLFRYILSQNNLEPGKDIFLDFSSNHIEVAAQMAAGRIEYALLPEPFVTIVVQKAAAEGTQLFIPVDLQRELIATGSFDVDYPMTALIIKNSICEDYPNIINQFLSIYHTSIDWVLNNPGEAGELAGDYLAMPGTIVTKAIPRLNIGLFYPRERMSEVMKFYRLLHSFNPSSVGGTVPDEGIFYIHQE